MDREPPLSATRLSRMLLRLLVREGLVAISAELPIAFAQK